MYSLTRCILLPAGLLLVLASPAAAQRSSADDQAVREIYDQFFETLRNGGATGVLDYLRNSGSVDPALLRDLEARVRSLRVSPLATRSDGYQLVDDLQVPNDRRVRSLRFLSYHENRPVAWRLRFYRKVNAVWILYGVEFETEFVDDFLRLSGIEFAAHRKILDTDFSAKD